MNIEQLKGETAFRQEVSEQNASIASVKTTRGLADLLQGQVPEKELVQLSTAVSSVSEDLNALTESVGDLEEDLSTLDGVAIKTSDPAIGFPVYATEARPTVVNAGLVIFDSTLAKLILWNGLAWVNLDGTALT